MCIVCFPWTWGAPPAAPNLSGRQAPLRAGLVDVVTTFPGPPPILPTPVLTTTWRLGSPSSCSATTQYRGTEMPWLMCRRLGPADAAKDGVPFAAESHPCGVSLDGTALGQPDGKPVSSTNYWRHRPSWSGLPRFWQPTKSAACQEPQAADTEAQKYARQTRKAMSVILQGAMAILLLRG